MKYKKIMFMLVLAIFIFGAASVCASDVNDTVIANLDDSAVGLSDCEKNNEISLTDEIQTTAEANKGEIMGNDNGGIVVSDSDELQETVLIVENDVAYQIPKVLEGEAYYHISLISNGSAVAGRTIYVDFDGEISNVNTSIYGEAIYKIPYVYQPGKYPLKVDFAGDDVYNPSTATAQVELLEVGTEIKPLINITKYSRIAVIEGNASYPILLTTYNTTAPVPLANKTVKVRFGNDDVEKFTTDSLGYINYTIPASAFDGNYSMEIIYDGEDGYEYCEFFANIEVYFIETQIIAFKNYSYPRPVVVHGDAWYPILLATNTSIPIANKTILIDFEDYLDEFTTDDFGYVNFTLPANTPAGNHTIVILYTGEDGYTSAAFDTIIEVYDVPTIISAHGNVSYPRPLVAEGHAYYCITLTTDTYVTINGTESRPVPLGNKTVTVDFIGIMESFTTDDFGLINITIAADVAPGNYTGTLSFVPDEDEGFIGSDLPITIEFYDVPTIISAQGNVSYPRPLVAEGHACYSITLMTDTYVTINGTECKPVPLGNKTVKVRFAKGDVEEFVTDVFGCINYTLPVNVGEGNYSIQVIFDYDGYKSSEFAANITVYKMPTSIELAEDDYAVYVDDAYGNLAVLQDKDGNNVTDGYSLIYTSDNESVVKIVNDSFVAVGEGNATITVSFNGTDMYESAEDKSFKVGVFKIPANIVLANDSIDIAALNVTSVGASLNPSEAGNLNYVSNDTNIAAVSPTGIIKANNVGTALITVSFAGNDKYAAAENKTMTVNVELADASVSVNNTSLDLFVDDNFTIVAATTPAGLNVTYVLDNSGVVSVDENGVVTALKEGTASLIVKVGGDGVYAENSTTVTVTVKKIPTEIIVQNATVDMKVGEEFDSVVGLIPSNAGRLSFSSSDDGVVLVNGYGYILAVGEGNATVTVAFDGNKKYAAANKNIAVTVSLNDASVSVNNSTLDLFAGDAFTIVANTTPAGLNVTYVPDNSGVVTVENGVITAVKEGTAAVTLKVGGDGVYALNSTIITVTVNKIDTTIIVDQDSLDLEVGDNSSISGTLTPADAGNVTFTSGDNKVVTVDAEGNVKAVGEGKAYITVSFDGNDKYNAAENKTVSVNVKDNTINVSALDVTKYYNGTESFVVIVTDSRNNPLANQSVIINVAGVNYTRTTDVNGTASIAISLISGQYNVTTIVGNNTVYSTVTVLPTVNATDLVKVFRNATQFYSTFKDSKGNYLAEGTIVRFNINGVMYDRKISGNNGLAKLNINLEQGQYIITSMNLETGENAANNVTVISRLIENKELVKYYRNATQYTVKVIGDDGNPVGAGESVTFNINGVIYTRQTNGSGIAKLNINLHPGDYIITAEYKDCRVSNNIKVLPVLTADDLTKKYGTPDQFIATLVDGQGKPYAGQTVKFNINGVFYTKTTGNDGIARLNINLLPGEYIITSSYNGLNAANKVTISG